MNIFSKYFSLLIVVFGFSVPCFSCQLDSMMSYNDLESTENYYVQPENIFVAPNGKIFVLFEEELFQVKTLCSDEKGIYVPSTEMFEPLVWCSICSHWMSPNHNCPKFG